MDKTFCTKTNWLVTPENVQHEFAQQTLERSFPVKGHDLQCHLESFWNKLYPQCL